MNSLDKQYTDLLQDILDNGVTKQDRTGTGTLSLFGKQIRHKMSEGFPLLTTKKMPFKLIATELMWFLRGDTNIKFLVDNDCNIWNGDAYKAYENAYEKDNSIGLSLLVARTDGKSSYRKPTKEQFIGMIQADNEFAKKWGELGPIYGKQWRSWYTRELMFRSDVVGEPQSLPEFFEVKVPIDQIANLINDLKTNPDSRRLMVNAWNVGELDQMVLPPCHYGFQVYTRELSLEERIELYKSKTGLIEVDRKFQLLKDFVEHNIPTRAISLMWNQRSVDTFLGLPFNIASYGLLLEIIAKSVNMVPDELIGNLGDTHLYLNHIEQAKEQIGTKLTHEERQEMLKEAMGSTKYQFAIQEQVPFSGGLSEYYDIYKIPYRTREPYPLPTLNINTEFWPTESGECGEGPIDAQAVFNNFTDEHFCKCLLEEDLQLSNYQSHPTIKAPLSN
jgi:thymidylate synthase